MSAGKESAYEWLGTAICVLIILGIIFLPPLLDWKQRKPDDCNTINHTRPFDGALCFPKHYDRSRQP